MARLLGVRANRVIAAAFAISGFLAAVVSLLFVAQTGVLAYHMGVPLVLFAFVATVVGGMGSLVGCRARGLHRRHGQRLLPGRAADRLAAQSRRLGLRHDPSDPAPAAVGPGQGQGGRGARLGGAREPGPRPGPHLLDAAGAGADPARDHGAGLAVRRRRARAHADRRLDPRGPGGRPLHLHRQRRRAGVRPHRLHADRRLCDRLADAQRLQEELRAEAAGDPREPTSTRFSRPRSRPRHWQPWSR